MNDNCHIRLPPPEHTDASMWLDEAIWGHMLYDEQGPWLIYLEFLNVLLDHHKKGILLLEPDGYNRLKYWAAWRLELRNVLFNNPRIAAIKDLNTSDSVRWKEWNRAMSKAGGIAQPDFSYIEKKFQSFDDFAEIVALLRQNGLEAATNKRWTSKYVFPYGNDCVYEYLDHNARTNDRHFFRRTGELLYLMLARSSKRDELVPLLEKEIINKKQSTWNRIVELLQPICDNPKGAERANTFLPYKEHECYDSLANDWIAILSLGMPGYDSLPHLVKLTAFHMIQYQLRVARETAGIKAPLKIVCEIVAPKKTLIREVSCDLYQQNNLLSTQAIMAYIDAIEQSDEWQSAKMQAGAYVNCKNILLRTVRWPETEDDYVGASNPDDLISEFRTAAKRRHQQHVANIHRNYGRDAGLVSKRGTVKLRYAPNDDFLKALIYANVNKRMELNLFLGLLWQRYGLIFGDREAEPVLDKGEFDKKAFQANARRLEQRLASLGLLKRLSDGCAYVLNPYSRTK
jgi:hypothetical protein